MIDIKINDTLSVKGEIVFKEDNSLIALSQNRLVRVVVKDGNYVIKDVLSDYCEPATTLSKEPI